MTLGDVADRMESEWYEARPTRTEDGQHVDEELRRDLARLVRLIRLVVDE